MQDDGGDIERRLGAVEDSLAAFRDELVQLSEAVTAALDQGSSPGPGGPRRP